jgi:hypothetical protein
MSFDQLGLSGIWNHSSDFVLLFIEPVGFERVLPSDFFLFLLAGICKISCGCSLGRRK